MSDPFNYQRVSDALKFNSSILLIQTRMMFIMSCTILLVCVSIFDLSCRFREIAPSVCATCVAPAAEDEKGGAL